MQGEVIGLANKSVGVQFDRETGAWVGLIRADGGMNLVSGGGIEAAFPLGSFREGAGQNLVVDDWRPSRNGRTIRFALRLDGWLCRVEYALDANKPLLRRAFAIENVSGERRVIRGLSFVLPWLALGPDAAVSFPGSFPVGDTPIRELPVAEGISKGDGVRPYKSKDPLACLWSAKKEIGIGAWFHSESEFCPVKVRRGRESDASICHNLEIIAPLSPGDSVSVGAQYVWVAEGSRTKLVEGVHDVYREVGLQPPKDGLKDLRRGVIYCGHPGGTPEQKYIGYGGFAAVTAYLPTLQKMGVTILWLLPIFEHGDGKKWNLYSPFDHYRIGGLYGTEEELLELSKSAAKLGIRLVFDLVPHGPPDDTELAKEHPEWTCVSEDGKPEYEWGQLAFDNANPEWQDYFARVAEYHARRFGIVGARVDVATGSKPNWRAPWRPSQSTLGGGLGMDRAIRAGCRRVRRQVMVLPEEYTGAAVYYRDTDITYDSQLFFLFVELQEKNASPETWAAHIAQFLHDQALVLPPGAVKMRFTANHDTVSWTCQKKRPRDAYGFERARALASLCALIEGTPMIYQGEENPAVYGGEGISSVDHIAAIMAIRRRLPGLTSCRSDYLGVESSGGVFSCVRGEGKESVLVLISFNPEAVITEVKLPAYLREVVTWQDALGLQRFHGGCAIPIEMAPHAVRVLTEIEQKGQI